MKIGILTAPSEGKNPENKFETESLSFTFEKPLNIASKASEKDLKCTGKRFEEGIILNKNISKFGTLEAINRYSGVVFGALDYENLEDAEKEFVNQNLFILSGMYGIVKPLDKICNYKLPIETKGLLAFWKGKITPELNKQNVDIWINLLPNSYAKMIDFSKLNGKVISVDFIKDGKKMSHGVKKYRGEFIKRLAKGEKFDFSEGKIVNIINS